MRYRGRRGLLPISILAAMGVLLLAAGSSAGGGDRGSGGLEGRAKDGLTALEDVRRNLDRARDHRVSGQQEIADAIGRAEESKEDFIRIAFAGYRYIEQCDAAGPLLVYVDLINRRIHRGYHVQGNERNEALERAQDNAEFLAENFAICAPGRVAVPNEMVARLRKLIREHKDGSVTEDKGQRRYRAARLKIQSFYRALVASAPDQVKGGCEVPAFQREFDALGELMTSATWVTTEFLLGFRKDASEKEEQAAKEQARRLRRKNLENAIQRTDELIERWKPCSIPICADQKDNEGDGATDAADPGCLTEIFGTFLEEDQSEEDAELRNSLCPPAGVAATPQNPSTAHVVNTNSGDELWSILLRNVTDGQILLQKSKVVDDDEFAGGSADLGAAVCGPGTNTTATWKVEEMTVRWDFVVTKPNKDVAPQTKRFVVAGASR